MHKLLFITGSIKYNRRLPTIYPTDVETCKLAESVNDVKTQLADVHLILKSLSDKCSF